MGISVTKTGITSSATKAENNATIGGVGKLLSPKAYQSICAVEKINSRIIIATFNGNPLATVISCYSPTNSTDEELAIEFYSNLSSLIRDIPKHNVKVIGGDMNAQIGKPDCKGSHFHEKTNRNGKLLTDLTNERDLIDLSTKYCKRTGKLWTFTYPNGNKAQLDHVLINKKWKNSALDCQANNTFCQIGSDHRPVTAKFRLSLRKNQDNKSKKIPYDWSKLVSDVNIK